jgi:hypothetical protein
MPLGLNVGFAVGSVGFAVGVSPGATEDGSGLTVPPRVAASAPSGSKLITKPDMNAIVSNKECFIIIFLSIRNKGKFVDPTVGGCGASFALLLLVDIIGCQSHQ